ncbi:unnamed protein product [Symbiodinium sp. CCMP2592]|nr:unnamed protein product [Symbiodinium sp. CCMP2592]
METGLPAGQGGGAGEQGDSPCKKQRGEDPGTLTLDMIREAMRAELGRSRDELGQSIASVREEVALFNKRVDGLEAGVTKQMDTTNKMFGIMTGNHDKQQKALEQIRLTQTAQAVDIKAFQGGQEELENRLAILEGKLKGSSVNGGSTADTEGPRRPALIIGGWPEDQPTTETLQKAKDILRQLDVLLDYSEMFVPGFKRGYAIVPIPQRWGETEDQRREIVQATLQKVRRANVMLGVNPAGGHRKLWMSLSQSPERRRKSRLAGKVKRALHGHGHAGGPQLEPGGLAGDKILELTRNFDDDPVVSRIHVLLLQEVVTDAGLYFAAKYDWVLVYGKKEGTWRGEGILYHSSRGLHHHSKVHTHALSTTIRCPRTHSRCRFLAAHLPHHATVEEAVALLAEWGEATPKTKGKLWIRMDANETFTTSDGGGGARDASRAIIKNYWQGWEHRLLDDIRWQKHLTQHFRSIFHKDELQLATATWHRGKATGPDGVALEALQAMLQHPRWTGRLQYLTRPITLSSAVLKWFGQTTPAPRGPPASGGGHLPMGAARTARHWGVWVWLVRLDIRKAFDSVCLVATRVGKLLATGGTAMGGSPWEARAWLGLLEPRELRVAIGNGVRQGSPDSPVLFAAIIATALDEVLTRTAKHLPPVGGPNPPQSGGAFMDDIYLWSHDRDHLQRTLTELEVRFAKDGLSDVACQPYGTVITALGSPFTFAEPVAAITAAMNERARKAFHKHSKPWCGTPHYGQASPGP